MKNASSASVSPSVSVRPSARLRPARAGTADNPDAEKFLAEALEELADLDEYAAECDLPPPSPKAKETARALLEKIVRAFPRYYAVSPWDKGTVVLHTTREGRRVSIRCGAGGEVSCIVVRSDGKSDAVWGRPGRDAPIGFICKALREMDARPE